jgi:L-ascorbate metabolism protein UlaG (beta-lactamase superfamily)
LSVSLAHPDDICCSVGVVAKIAQTSTVTVLAAETYAQIAKPWFVFTKGVEVGLTIATIEVVALVIAAVPLVHQSVRGLERTGKRDWRPVSC